MNLEDLVNGLPSVLHDDRYAEVTLGTVRIQNMVLSQLTSFTSSSRENVQFNADGNVPAGAQDSITLGQLKSMVSSAPKQKQALYDFKYDDEDTVSNEIEEFYSYAESSQFAENLKAWEGSFQGEWTKSPSDRRKAHIEILLESLEHRNPETRYARMRQLLYVLQGTFAETTCPEHQLLWIVENCKLVRGANGVARILEAMKIACAKHDWLFSISDAQLFQVGISPADKAECIEEINTELSVFMGMLYHLVEILKGHDDFAEELMSLDPPLPVFLFNVVGGLRDKSAKGYPVKKLLLLLWKSLLATCGGIRELARSKVLARDIVNLPPQEEEVVPIKSSPFDMNAFRQEISVKYPTFTQPPPTQSPAMSVAPLKLATAFSPIPVRHHYHHGEDEGQHVHPMQQHPSSGGQGPSVFHQLVGGYNPNPTAQPLTPAPTPPPSPKPKKQQFQTDQNRPFLLPFSRTRIKDGRLVPFAIDEADRLYAKHMHVSLSLWQMWRIREECMIAESGLERMPGSDICKDESALSSSKDSEEPLSGILYTQRRPRAPSDRLDDEDTQEELPDISILDQKIAEADTASKKADASGDRSAKRKSKEKREDFQRLKHVEQIYAAAFPGISNWVLVLLKLLLATVSAGGNSQPPPSATSASGFPQGLTSRASVVMSGFMTDGMSGPAAEQQPPAPPLTQEETDVLRHREITSKAVSAIILLTLRWFKVSHIMKFHYLGQQLLDSNCLLLILKMFGLQEVASTVVSKAEVPDLNFFRYCHLNFSRNPQPSRPEDSMLTRPRTSSRPPVYSNNPKGDEDIELLTDFSWRNFFSSINFIKIMQKLSKHRSHRIWLLVQYKSSAILKRILKVHHQMLQLHVLKLIKSQVPYCGRKWRQSNMKVITSIYLNCRPDLRDEWLTGTEVEDVQDALAQEQALRKLVKFYNNKRYGPATSHAASQNHRRSSSMSVPLEGLPPGPELSAISRPVGTPNVTETDVFPPLRSQIQDPSVFLPYTTEDIAFEEEYEEYLSDLSLGQPDEQAPEGPLFGGASAWHRLPHIGEEVADGISDSESITSIGELDEGRLDVGSVESDRESIDENRNNWEHMSPKTMAALPKSPGGGHRRSSSGSSLRPVLPFGLDDASAVDLEDDEDEEPMGPMPREQPGPFASGGGVDEVEYAYGL